MIFLRAISKFYEPTPYNTHKDSQSYTTRLHAGCSGQTRLPDIMAFLVSPLSVWDILPTTRTSINSISFIDYYAK